MKGSLQATPLAEVLRDLLFDQRTGTLAIAGGPARTEIMVDHGAVVYAKSDHPDQKLERLLVRWGFLTEEQLPSFVQRAGRDVRGTLLKDGIFPTSQAFDDFMAEILRERALEPFQQTSGAWEFEDRDVSAFRTLRFPATTPNVILEGCRRLPPTLPHLDALRDDDAALIPNEKPAVTLEALQMAPAEGYVLSLITGTATLGDVARLSPVGVEETLRLLYALLVLDLVRHPRFVNERFTVAELSRRRQVDGAREHGEREAIRGEYERLRGTDLFQIVPNASAMGSDQLRQSVRAYQDRWRTERFSPRVARELREELLVISGRAGELLLAAMDAESRQMLGSVPADEVGAGDGNDEAFRLKRLDLMKSQAQEEQQQDDVAARQSFLRAQEASRAKDYHAAIQHLRDAIRRNERAEYHALLGDVLAMNPHWGKKAEEAYLRAMQLDPYDATLPLALGRIYAKAGLKQRAREQFEHAAALAPDLEDVRQALRDLGR
jgi:tetratricopeptide (TPR) repeat protein